MGCFRLKNTKIPNKGSTCWYEYKFLYTLVCIGTVRGYEATFLHAPGPFLLSFPADGSLQIAILITIHNIFYNTSPDALLRSHALNNDEFGEHGPSATVQSPK